MSRGVDLALDENSALQSSKVGHAKNTPPYRYISSSRSPLLYLQTRKKVVVLEQQGVASEHKDSHRHRQDHLVLVMKVPPQDALKY